MKQDEVEVDRLRIWDFYLAFPGEVRKMTFPQELYELKKIFKEKEANPYEDLIDAKKVIDRMKEYQITAMKAIASYGIIDVNDLSKGWVRKIAIEKIPDDLKVILSTSDVEKTNILKLITGFRDLPLIGKKGLKARTGLIEFRYDSR